MIGCGTGNWRDGDHQLRDVVAGAIADAGDPNDEALIIELLMRRLGKAMMIELDDGTVFVRRPAIRRTPA
jgi:hypothetical protein